ncbi:butyrophilin subfamily 2 member A2-like isoform X2 [Malaclemys terrapin pileata]|uniref:butyrophilin subfamily 2 member A2-like isoform X2 n=1 Tax=Malaclemys terrapin pileata TaxID=2991368 RepID=UPI0023A7BE41|nr:butyrophilin subfamily 2 member A2-like isoform X2 [Malaclemys terrapin pileata]
MKISSFGCSSRTSSAQMSLIIFPIICHIRKLESAQFAVVVPDHSVTAIVGEEFVLPCHLSPRMNAQNMEVKWLRPHLSSVVHLYRDGKDRNESQTLEYQGRTEFLKDGLSTGSVDLKIHNIRPSDEGLYRCFIRSSTFYGGALLELKVAGLGSDPHLSVEGYQDGGIQVVCRSAGWYPEPEVLWRDLGGRRLPSVSETTSRRDNGLFETQTAFLITERSNQNLSCCIRNTFLNQEKESTIYVAEKLVAELRWRRVLTHPVNVTLDPDTAHPRLIVSEDRKSVRQGDIQQDLPDNPERFDYECCVLGCEGFTSGSHYWEVEAGDGKYWAVGVARASVSRKGEFMSNLNPEVGIWAVRLYGGQYQVLTSPKIPLTLRRGPSRIRVCLDYERGQLAFFDAENQAPIFTFPPACFTGERIHPWLWVRGGSQLSLCH